MVRGISSLLSDTQCLSDKAQDSPMAAASVKPWKEDNIDALCRCTEQFQPFSKDGEHDMYWPQANPLLQVER